MHPTRYFLERSLSIDSNYARPLALLADTYLIAYRLPLDDDYLDPTALDLAYRQAYDALQYALVSFVLGFKRQHDAPVAELEKALLLNLNYTDWRLAMALVIAAEYARAIDTAQAHMRADPFYPARTVPWLGIAYYMLKRHHSVRPLKRHSEALPDLREAVSRAPNTLGCHLWSAANFAQLKRLEEAQREGGTVLQIDSEFTVERQERVMAVCKHRRGVSPRWPAQGRTAGHGNRHHSGALTLDQTVSAASAAVTGGRTVTRLAPPIYSRASR